jgi:hypothetical protein
MNEFFLSVLMLDQAAFIGLGISLIIAGGFLGAWLFDVEIVLRRVSYLWFVALAGLAFAISQSIWTYPLTAMDAGFLWALALVGFGAYVAFGMATYFGAAARSRHIDGTTDSAWMGFVPLVNLWLLFKGSNVKSDAGHERSAIARFVIDPVLVVAALFVLSLTQVVNQALVPAENDDYRNPVDDPAFLEMLSQPLPTVLGYGFETALCAGYAAILTTVAASASRAFCSALI